MTVGAGSAAFAAAIRASNLVCVALVETWAPYLTMAEGIELAAQTFRTNAARLSCCPT